MQASISTLLSNESIANSELGKTIRSELEKEAGGLSETQLATLTSRVLDDKIARASLKEEAMEEFEVSLNLPSASKSMSDMLAEFCDFEQELHAIEKKVGPNKLKGVNIMQTIKKIGSMVPKETEKGLAKMSEKAETLIMQITSLKKEMKDTQFLPLQVQKINELHKISEDCLADAETAVYINERTKGIKKLHEKSSEFDTV